MLRRRAHDAIGRKSLSLFGKFHANLKPKLWQCQSLFRRQRQVSKPYLLARHWTFGWVAPLGLFRSLRQQDSEYREFGLLDLHLHSLQPKGGERLVILSPVWVGCVVAFMIYIYICMLLALFLGLFACFVRECFCGCVHVSLGTGRSMIVSCLCETMARGRIKVQRQCYILYCMYCGVLPFQVYLISN